MFKCVLPKFQSLQGSSLEQLRLVSDRYFFVKTNELGYQRLLEMVEGYECEEIFLEIPGPTGVEYIIVSEKYKFVGWCGEILQSSFCYTMNYLGLDDKYPKFMYDVIFDKDNVYRKQSDVDWADELCNILKARQAEIKDNLDDIVYEILNIEEIVKKYPYLEEYATTCMVDVVVNNDVDTKLQINTDLGEFEDFQYGSIDFYQNNYYIVPLTLVTEHYKFLDNTSFTDTIQKDSIQRWMNLVEQQFELLKYLDGFGIGENIDISVPNRAFAHQTIYNVAFMVNFIKKNINDARYDISLLTVICGMTSILQNCKHMYMVSELFTTYKVQLNQLSNLYKEYMDNIVNLVELIDPKIY